MQTCVAFEKAIDEEIRDSAVAKESKVWRIAGGLWYDTDILYSMHEIVSFILHWKRRNHKFRSENFEGIRLSGNCNYCNYPGEIKNNFCNN